MHPALSVIFFTVTAGAGYGLLFMLAFAHMAPLSETISPDHVTWMGLFGLVLVTAGLVSSTFHLANPKNAWRAFTRFKTSWLSREAVFAVAFYPISLLWLVFEFLTGNSLVTQVLALMTAALSLVVLICTAMIYASLKTIRQWYNPLTPVNFVLMGCLSGALILAALFAWQGLDMTRLLNLTIVVLLLCSLVKITYFFWIGQPAGPTINTALGFTRATVKLLDVGHSSDTFHTQEFGFQVKRVRILWLRGLCIVLSFVVPLLLLLSLVAGQDAQAAADSRAFGPLLLAALSAYAGVFIERWLFFAEARHVVNLYHGAVST